MEKNSNINNNDNSINSSRNGILHKYSKSIHISIVFALSVSTLLLLLDNFSVDKVLGQSYPFIANTRGSFNITNGNMIQQPDLPAVQSILNIDSCPGEIAIYVHGIWANKYQAEEQTERVSLSLQNAGYEIPIIGFSWDSDTAFSLDDTTSSPQGWIVAKKIANENGPILGKFIIDFKDKCPDDTVKIIAHSLGSRVTLSSLQWIYDNDNERNINNNLKKIATVHLVGAAVNDNQISTNPDDCSSYTPALSCSGIAINSEVGHLYNLFNPQDNMLTSDTIPNPFCWYCPDIFIPSPYQLSENKYALGAYGIEDITNAPSNYTEYSVLSNVIFDADANKDNQCDTRVNLKFFVTPFNYYSCTITKDGDNHMGYMGYRDSIDEQKVHNIGAIGNIVTDWLDLNN